MKIVVLAGGRSSEREVSMTSGSKVANALIAKGHQVLLIDLLTGTPKYTTFDRAYKELRTDYYYHQVSEKIPDLEAFSENEIGSNILEICDSADITFLALHGGIGENGKLQGMFDIYNIKYTGSDAQSSLLAMNKLLAKKMMLFHGIPTANWRIVSNFNHIEGIKLPAVVKPIDGGSSIGISMAETEKELESAIEKVQNYTNNSQILVEDKIIGREFSVGILGEQVLPIIELIPRPGFYDYRSKYQSGRSKRMIPAQINERFANQMKVLAKNTHRMLGLSVYSRTDFLIDKRGDIFVLEVNSLPGMTPNCLFPQDAAAAGISFNDLCEAIVNESMKKYEVKG
ncbi:D-alanine-D-alanine ligase [Enterococcus sp. AZ135]|uniref:D-alanine--D-alanine ligase family protein n=1 Tax=unclassified Enterococcus TaxID=2608891 RepID=UPI003F24C74D